MNNSRLLLSAVVLTLSLAASQAWAQVPTCFDEAKSNADVDQCEKQLIPLIEQKIDKEYKRLSEKFKDNEKMQEVLRSTKQSWANHRNLQCMFEGMAASGGQAIKPFSFEANKAYFKCMVLNLNEMKASLEKF